MLSAFPHASVNVSLALLWFQSTAIVMITSLVSWVFTNTVGLDLLDGILAPPCVEGPPRGRGLK